MTAIYKAIDIETYNKLVNSTQTEGEKHEAKVPGIEIKEIVECMPNKQKKKSMRLLTFVNNGVSNVVWDGMGQIIIDDMVIPNSHIVDVIAYITSSGGFKQKAPDGVKQILKVLFANNIPKNFLGSNAFKITNNSGTKESKWLDFDSIVEASQNE